MPTLSRRGFLRGLMGVAAVCAVPTIAQAKQPRIDPMFTKPEVGARLGNGRLILVHGHEEAKIQSIDLVFRQDVGASDYDMEALEKLNEFLEDFHAAQRLEGLDRAAQQAGAALEWARDKLAKEGESVRLRRWEETANERFSAASAAFEQARNDIMHPIDPRLLDAVSELQRRSGGHPLVVQSAYRNQVMVALYRFRQKSPWESPIFSRWSPL